MARRPVTMKFEDEDLARWDAVAEANSFSRTALFERAMVLLLDGEVDEVVVPAGDVSVLRRVGHLASCKCPVCRPAKAGTQT